MSDNDLPPEIGAEHLLANAYLDNELTARERERVEQSPEIRALVAPLRAVQDALADTFPIVTRRETAISVALGEFDRLQLMTSELPAGGSVVALADRRRWPKAVLSAAAALLLVGIVGTAALRSSSDSSSETASLDTTAKVADAASDTADDGATVAAAPAAAEDVSLALAEPIEIVEPAQLLAIAADDEQMAERQMTYSSHFLACMRDGQLFLADISYRGTVAIAVRDTVTGETHAVDENCVVLASAKP